MSDGSVLRIRRFRWFFLSRLVNLAGGTMASVAIAFAVLDVSDSASALGQVLAARTIPLVVFLLLGGVLADRLPRALVIQVSNVLAFVTQGLVAYLVISGRAEIWHLLILEFLNGTTSAASMPAMQGLLPQLVPRAALQRANVLLSMSRGGLNVVGPSIAAGLVVTVGPGWAVAVDAATWLVAAVLLIPVRTPPREARADRTSSLWWELREGWTIFRRTTWLWVVVAAFGVLNAMHSGALLTLGPVIAKNTFGIPGWGLAMSAEAVGLLLTTFVLLKVSLRFPLRSGMLGIATLAAPMLVLGLVPDTTPLMLAMLLAGAGTELFGLGWNLAMQENIPEEMLSRASSYDMLGSFVAIPAGQILYGPLGDWFGYRPVLVVSGVLYLVICLAVAGVPAVRNLTRAQPDPEAARS